MYHLVYLNNKNIVIWKKKDKSSDKISKKLNQIKVKKDAW